MALPSRRTLPRALTASATKLTRRENAYSKRLSQSWQLRSLSYYDQIGEVRFASQFYAKLLSRVRYFPARQLEDGTVEPIESGLPMALLHQVQDPGGGRSRLQYDYGRMMFVTGEGVLFADESEDVQRWRFLWKDEVKFNESVGAWERVTFDKRSFDPPQFGEAYRFWTPHPRHSDEADCPLRAVMDIAEELLALTASVMGTATTRRTNGMFVIPTEISPSPFTNDEYEGDEDPQTNPFLSDMVEHMGAQIENPGTAESKVPFLLEGPYEYIDKVRWVPFHDPQTDYMERELRKEAVHRLALGMDFPPEFLLGMTDANHWTARQVVFDMWRSYGSPIAERFADDLADSYLRPALRNEGFPEWQEIVIGYDDSQVVISPDKTEVAKQALEMIAIGRPGYRQLAGIDEKLAPDEDEEEFLASLKLRQPIEIENGDLVIPQRGPVPQTNGNQPEDGPPVPTAGRDTSRQEARVGSALLQGAASAALMRCRELAGVRIRHSCEDCEGESLSVVAASAPPEYLNDARKLVAGGTDFFSTLLREWGFTAEQTRSLCQQLETFAARTLNQGRCPQLPSGFVASLEAAKEVSENAVAH